jgi:hypothetical protein
LSVDRDLELIFYKVAIGEIGGHKFGFDVYGLWNVVWIFSLPTFWEVAEAPDESL